MNKKIIVAGAAAMLATGVALAQGLDVSGLKASPVMSKAAAHMTLSDNCSGNSSTTTTPTNCSGNGGCSGSSSSSSSTNGSCGGCGGCGTCGGGD